MSGFRQRQCLGGNNLIIEVNFFHSFAPVCPQFYQCWSHLSLQGGLGVIPAHAPGTQEQQEGEYQGVKPAVASQNIYNQSWCLTHLDQVWHRQDPQK